MIAALAAPTPILSLLAPTEAKSLAGAQTLDVPKSEDQLKAFRAARNNLIQKQSECFDLRQNTLETPYKCCDEIKDTVGEQYNSMRAGFPFSLQEYHQTFCKYHFGHLPLDEQVRSDFITLTEVFQAGVRSAHVCFTKMPATAEQCCSKIPDWPGFDSKVKNPALGDITVKSLVEQECHEFVKDMNAFEVSNASPGDELPANVAEGQSALPSGPSRERTQQPAAPSPQPASGPNHSAPKSEQQQTGGPPASRVSPQTNAAPPNQVPAQSAQPQANDQKPENSGGQGSVPNLAVNPAGQTQEQAPQPQVAAAAPVTHPSGQSVA